MEQTGKIIERQTQSLLRSRNMALRGIEQRLDSLNEIEEMLRNSISDDDGEMVQALARDYRSVAIELADIARNADAHERGLRRLQDLRLTLSTEVLGDA